MSKMTNEIGRLSGVSRTLAGIVCTMAVALAALVVTLPRSAYASGAANTVRYYATPIRMGQVIEGTYDYNADGNWESYYYTFTTNGKVGTYRITIDSLTGRCASFNVTNELNSSAGFSNSYVETWSRGSSSKSDSDFFKTYYIKVYRSRWENTRRYDKYRLVVDFLPSVSEMSVSGLTTKAYTGNGITQNPKVTYGSKVLRNGVDYTLSYSDNVEPGTATVTVTGIGDYSGSITKTFQIAYGKNPIKAQGKKVTLKSKSIKRHSKTISRAKAIKVSGAKGEVTYKKLSGSKKFAVNKYTGNITAKKGTKKGTYRIKVRVSAAGLSSYYDGYYNKGSKIVTVTIKVK